MTPDGPPALPTRRRPPVFAATKFLPPPPPAVLVPRTALLERLEADDDLPLTVVVGSAGSGKTSLLAEWVGARPGGRTTWIATDRGDTDPVRFWYGFVSAVGLVDPAFGETAADLITLDGEVGPDVLEAILVDDAALTDRIRVVVDDVHQLSPEVMSQLQHLIDRGLRHLRLVLAGRSDPDVGLHRLRLRGGLCEVREADLRFDGSETRALVDHLGVDTTRIDVDALQARTEGWPAAVQMAALTMAASDDPAARLRALVGSTQTIGGYLASEVLASQAPHLRRFLEDTCVVDELDAELCSALTAGSGEASAVTLASVEAAHLLLSRVDPAGTTFRYHQLFAEMLRNHLRLSDPERFRRQHLRAAEALRTRGDSPAVIAHYWAAGRNDLASQYTRQRPIAGYIDSPHLEVQPDIEVRREDVLTAPGDVVGYALALLLAGRPRDSQVVIDRVAALVRPDELDAVDRAHLLGVALGAALLRGDSRLAVERLEEAVELVPPQPGQDELLDLMVVTGVRALVWEGRHQRAAELSSMLDLSDRPLLGADVTGALAFADLERGQLDRAASRAAEALRVLDEHGAATSGTAIAAHAVLAVVHLDRGEVERAEHHLAAVRVEHQPSRVPSFVLAAVTRARLMRLHARFDAAFVAVTDGRYALGESAAATTLGERLDVTEIMLHLAVGAPERAAALIERLRPGWERSRAEAWHAIETGRVDLAAELAAGLAAGVATEIAADPGSTPGGLGAGPATPRRQLDVALLRARLALDGVGSERVGDAGAAIETVLDLVETTGAVMLVAEAGTGVLQAAVERARRRARTPAVERLLVTRPLQRPVSQATPDYSIDQLSAREIVVLRYLATSMSNQEIADALYLSVNTVKTHIKHILRKLAASSRAEAVRRAHALHYL